MTGAIKAMAHTKPSLPQTSDDFNDAQLGLQWQWCHNPDNGHWSLTERKGWLTLHAQPSEECSKYADTEDDGLSGRGYHIFGLSWYQGRNIRRTALHRTGVSGSGRLCRGDLPRREWHALTMTVGRQDLGTWDRATHRRKMVYGSDLILVSMRWSELISWPAL